MSAAGGLRRRRDWMQGKGYREMQPRPALLLRRHEVLRRGGAFNEHEAIVNRRNAVYGGARIRFICDECRCEFHNVENAARHAARTGHIVLREAMTAIVAVDPDDSPEFWEDEWGVDGEGRHPVKSVRVAE